MNSPPCPSTPRAPDHDASRPLRIFSTNSPCTAIARSTTNLIRVPCPLLTPRRSHSKSAVEALSGLFLDTRLEADLPDLLWSFVNLFHRKAERIDRELDDNETAQRALAGRTGRLGNPLGRTGAVDRARADAHRTAQRLRILPRPSRRTLRDRDRLRPGVRARARRSITAR